MRAALNPVDHLASLLAPAVRLGGRAMPQSGEIDTVIAALQRQIKSGSTRPLNADLQHDAAQRFWRSPRLQTLKDARLVAFGLGLPVGPGGARIIDDKARFDAVLRGVDQWLNDARWFRRCYQGLVWSYFNCDIDTSIHPSDARHNWLRLRDYLSQRAPRTVSPEGNPDWVKTVICQRHLFGDAACERHAGDLLRGNHQEVHSICEQLGINGSSWFLRGLVLAQVSAATKLGHDEFRAALPRLIELLSDTRALRDEGLALLLDRYQQLPQAPLHAGLRDAAASWWGSPWLATNEFRWSGMSDGVRRMVSEWIQCDLIDRFFAAAGDGPSGRRAAFWKRYVKSNRLIGFALGGSTEQAEQSRARLGVQRVTGSCASLVDGSPTQSALVLTMGRAVIVEFGDLSVPLHGYDLRHSQPFDLSCPVSLEEDAGNSLRQRHRSLLLPHQDGLEGWRRWEQMFEAAISDQFGVRPGTAPSTDETSCVDLSDPADPIDRGDPEPLGQVDEPRWQTSSSGEDAHWLTAEAASVPYSRADLEVLARVHALRIEDDSSRSSRLWVRTDQGDHRIARVLTGWGFVHRPGEGWLR